MNEIQPVLQSTHSFTNLNVSVFTWSVITKSVQQQWLRVPAQTSLPSTRPSGENSLWSHLPWFYRRMLLTMHEGLLNQFIGTGDRESPP